MTTSELKSLVRQLLREIREEQSNIKLDKKNVSFKEISYISAKKMFRMEVALVNVPRHLDNPDEMAQAFKDFLETTYPKNTEFTTPVFNAFYDNHRKSYKVTRKTDWEVSPGAIANPHGWGSSKGNAVTAVTFVTSP